MRTKNDIFRGYLQNGLAVSQAALAAMDRMISEASDFELLRDLAVERENAVGQVSEIQSIINRYGGQLAEIKKEISTFWIRGESFLSESDTENEKILLRLMDLLGIEQVLVATDIGLIELARSVGDAEAERAFLGRMEGFIKGAERFQERLPSAISGAFQSIELKRGA